MTCSLNRIDLDILICLCLVLFVCVCFCYEWTQNGHTPPWNRGTPSQQCAFERVPRPESSAHLFLAIAGYLQTLRRWCEGDEEVVNKGG